MKIGLIAVGLNTYWHQFGGLRERLDGYRNAIKEKMEAYGGQIVAEGPQLADDSLADDGRVVLQQGDQMGQVFPAGHKRRSSKELGFVS